MHHGIIQPIDLACDRMLISKLLKWFQRPATLRHKECLELIHKICLVSEKKCSLACDMCLHWWDMCFYWYKRHVSLILCHVSSMFSDIWHVSVDWYMTCHWYMTFFTDICRVSSIVTVIIWHHLCMTCVTDIWHVSSIFIDICHGSLIYDMCLQLALIFLGY